MGLRLIAARIASLQADAEEGPLCRSQVQLIDAVLAVRFVERRGAVAMPGRGELLPVPTFTPRTSLQGNFAIFSLEFLYGS